MGLFPIFLLTSGAVTKLLWDQIMNENSLLYYKRSNTPPKTVLKTCLFVFYGNNAQRALQPYTILFL